MGCSFTIARQHLHKLGKRVKIPQKKSYHKPGDLGLSLKMVGWGLQVSCAQEMLICIELSHPADLTAIGKHPLLLATVVFFCPQRCYIR